MQMSTRRASERGGANHGWLNTKHSFSFARYYDPRFMGFGPLRVINQDRVAPGRGFGTHAHRNMEIISYVVAGSLAHRDTIGTDGIIVPGEVQLMSAGSGISHSEMNASREAEVHFLQIWVTPSALDTPPRYDQRAFSRDERGLRLVVSPDGRDGSLTIGQDADLHRLLLRSGESAEHHALRHRVWVQVVHGQLAINGTQLQPGDGLAITAASALRFEAHADTEALVFDMI